MSLVYTLAGIVYIVVDAVIGKEGWVVGWGTGHAVSVLLGRSNSILLITLLGTGAE